MILRTRPLTTAIPLLLVMVLMPMLAGRSNAGSPTRLLAADGWHWRSEV